MFNISKVGKVAGCRVTEGKVERGAQVRLIRDNVVIHEGKLSTLKRFKDEVREVTAGQECGMAFENYQDMRAGRRHRVLRGRARPAHALVAAGGFGRSPFQAQPLIRATRVSRPRQAALAAPVARRRDDPPCAGRHLLRAAKFATRC